LLSHLKRFFKFSRDEIPSGRQHLLLFAHSLKILGCVMFHTLSVQLQNGLCFFQTLVLPPQQHALRFACRDFTRRGDSIATFRIIDPVSNLGAPFYAGGSAVPCRQLENLQLDHLCKHRETQLRPGNPRRSVAFCDDAYGRSINLTVLLDPSP